MNILQRYVLKELAAPTVVSLLFFTLILLLRGIFKLAEFLLAAQIGAMVMLELVGFIAILVFALTIPMAALLGVLIGVGRMTSENEILAIRVAGISVVPVFAPVFIAATIVSCALVYGNMVFFPQMTKRMEARKQEIKFELLTSMRRGVWHTELAPKGSNLALYFEEDGAPQAGDGRYTQRLGKVAIVASGFFEETDQQTSKGAKDQNKTDDDKDSLIFAEQGIIRGYEDTGVIEIELLNGTVVPAIQSTPDQTVMLRFDRMAKTIDPGKDDEGIAQLDPKMLTSAEISERLANPPTSEKFDSKGRPRRAWRPYFEMRTEWWIRISLPFSVLAFTLLAVPLAMEIRPRAKSVSFLLAFGLMMLYYGVLTWAQAVGTSGSDLVGLAFMAPNVVVALAGAYMLTRVQRVAA